MHIGHTYTYKPKWKRRDLMLFFERLELYISSGLTIDKSLAIVSDCLSPSHKQCMEKVSTDVLSGISLSRSLMHHIRISKNISGLIEQGEYSGKLAYSLGAAHALLEKEDELYKKCISALAYPIIIGTFASLLTIGLVRGVMPQIIPMLKSLNIQLPFLTRMVISLSENFIGYGLYIIAGGIIIILLHVVCIKKIRLYKKLIHNVLIRIPLVGKLFYAYSLSLFLQSCGILIESGVAATHAYAQTASAVSLLPLSDKLQEEIGNIQEGMTFASALKKSRYIPLFIPSLISAGEASGMLGTSLRRAASILDRDIDHSLKRLTSLIEPIMMAGMGCVVGGIALSIMMPIYDISKVLQQ